jgi:hypothetical protein
VAEEGETTSEVRQAHINVVGAKCTTSGMRETLMWKKNSQPHTIQLIQHKSSYSITTSRCNYFVTTSSSPKGNIQCRSVLAPPSYRLSIEKNKAFCERAAEAAQRQPRTAYINTAGNCRKRKSTIIKAFLISLNDSARTREISFNNTAKP